MTDSPAPAAPTTPRSPLDALTDAIGALACRATAETPPAPPSSAPPSPTPAPHRLGALSERYESGGRGPGTVSSGRNDPGGVSYGLYQLASGAGTVAEFLAAEGQPWAAGFAPHAPGSAPFSAVWRAVAMRDGAAFGAAQHAFIARSHYWPAVAAVKAQTGLDLDRRASAVRDACWSTAVQHGRAALLLGEAVAAADAAPGREAAGYDRALIMAIYAARTAYVQRLAGRLNGGSRRALQDIAAKRYPAELAGALAMLTR